MTRCQDTFRERCELQQGHDGMHRRGERTWGFTDTRPEWVRRALRHEMTAKELVTER